MNIIPFFMGKKSKNEFVKAHNWFEIAVGVAMILTILGFSTTFIDQVIHFFISLAIGGIMSGIATALVEKYGGDILEKYLIKIKIGKFKFSITFFTIAVMIIETWLF